MHKQTIALIDHDRNILTSLSRALEKEGFKVQTYIDGESALIGLTRTPPDIAVIDIKMPKMDGEELLKKLRKKTSLPVIFLTSKDDEIDELLALLFADDVSSFNDTVIRLQRQINCIEEFCNIVGMQINLDKTKIVVFRNGGILKQSEVWYYNNEKIAKVSFYKCLGIFSLYFQISEKVRSS